MALSPDSRSSTVMFSARRALPSLGVTTKRIFPFTNFLSAKTFSRIWLRDSRSGSFVGRSNLPDHAHQFFDIFFLQTGSLRRHMRCRNHPKGDCFSMKERSVTCHRFDGVSERMAKVQQGAASGGFSFIFLDKRGFDLDASPDQIRKIPVPSRNSARSPFSRMTPYLITSAKPSFHSRRPRVAKVVVSARTATG